MITLFELDPSVGRCQKWRKYGRFRNEIREQASNVASCSSIAFNPPTHTGHVTRRAGQMKFNKSPLILFTLRGMKEPEAESRAKPSIPGHAGKIPNVIDGKRRVWKEKKRFVLHKVWPRGQKHSKSKLKFCEPTFLQVNFADFSI